jgi:hypothetical protein
LFWISENCDCGGGGGADIVDDDIVVVPSVADFVVDFVADAHAVGEKTKKNDDFFCEAILLTTLQPLLLLGMVMSTILLTDQHRLCWFSVLSRRGEFFLSWSSLGSKKFQF